MPLIGGVLHRRQSQAVNGFKSTAFATAKAPLIRVTAFFTGMTERGLLNLTLLSPSHDALLPVFFFLFFPFCVRLFQTAANKPKTFLSMTEDGLIRTSQTCGISTAACQLCCCSLWCDDVKPPASQFNTKTPPNGARIWSEFAGT